MKKLSIIIPVYNEEKTVAKIIKKIIAVKFPIPKTEYIIIDDGSTDNSAQIIKKIKLPRNWKIIQLKKNRGKGAAVITGIKKATGDYIIIQDADLEYEPKDMLKILQPVLNSKSLVVYGTRLKRNPNFARDERTVQFFFHYMGNKFLSLITSMLYFHWVTDMECCYKLFPKNALNGTILHARGFEFEPEITAKLLKKNFKMTEVSISTNPRGYDEGKKLNTVKDGTKALWTLLKYRFID
ncbi:MAG: glycosyltransferase family 2 protein [Candidatus Levyibacteriota bacterium]